MEDVIIEEGMSLYETQVINVLGNIQGYLIFFIVVLLFYFAYKFLRMFF